MFGNKFTAEQMYSRWNICWLHHSCICLMALNIKTTNFKNSNKFNKKKIVFTLIALQIKSLHFILFIWDKKYYVSNTH